MFKYIPVRKQLRAVEKQNVQLRNETEQTRADLEFVAIMADIEIPEDEEEEAEA